MLKRYRFVFLAIILLALAGWLMHGRDAAKAEERLKDVRMPRYPTPDEYQKRNARKTLMQVAAENQPQVPPVPRDPLLEVLPYDEHKGTVIIEAAAIRYSELGERILDCMNQDAAGELERMKEETGIDLLDSVDRIGLSERTLVLTGNFQGLQLKEAEHRAYGDHATIYGLDGGSKVALWNDQVLMMNVEDEQAEQMIDRLEGRAERTAPTFPEHMEYGEIYGWMPVDGLAHMVPDDEHHIGEKLQAAADKVELHVSIANDVGIVARVTGKDESIRDLGKSIGGAMALGRTFATSREEKDLAEILELARVVPRGEAFDVELALPSDVLLRQLGGECSRRVSTDAGVTTE